MRDAHIETKSAHIEMRDARIEMKSARTDNLEKQFIRDTDTTNHVQKRIYEIYVIQNRKLREFER